MRTKLRDRRRLLLLANLLILLLVCGSLEALPRQATAQEIQEHVPEALEVVSP